MASRSASAARLPKPRCSTCSARSPFRAGSSRRTRRAAGKENVVVIGWGLWQRRFGGGNVIGKTLDFDGRRLTVIGVMPPGFAFPTKKSEFWAPLVVSERAKRRVGYWLQMVGRLKPGVTPRAGADRRWTSSASSSSSSIRRQRRLRDLRQPARESRRWQRRTPLLVLLGAVGFVLLIACVNVAGLFLARRSRAAARSSSAPRWARAGAA